MYTSPLDPGTPTDGNWLKEGAARIREAKAALIERLETIFVDLDADPLVFQNNIIPQAALIDLIISTAKLADLAVTTAKLADLSVTDPKIVGMDGAKLTDNTVVAAKLVDLIITQSKLADGAAGTLKLADLAVTAAKIALLTITGAQVANDTLDDPKLAPHLRQSLVKQSHVDFAVATFSLATNSIWDSADLVIGGVTELDSLIVSVESASAAWAAAMKLITFYAFVSSAGNVRLRLQNNSGGPATIPNSNWRIMALRRYSDWYP